ncbi:MAG: amidohydrolase family protein [Acidobacteria bacterium]|nr:amidohydrolase family protein [Acidobacteriota bacterium]
MLDRLPIALISLVALAACGSQGGGSGSAPEPADYVFTNGTVYTVDDQHPEAAAVAVAGNRIAFVGSTADAQDHVGPNTEVIDVEGQMILPGFVSAHDHLITSGFLKFDLSLYGASSRQETLDMIADYAVSHPEEPVILGIGWAPTVMGGLPTMAELDAAVPDRPALIVEANTHEAWFNRAALETAGISTDAPDRQPGLTYWVRDESGQMTGVAYEFQWLDIYLGLGLWNLEASLADLQQQYVGVATESGITTFLAPGVFLPSTLTQEGQFEEVEYVLDYLAELEAADRLSMRVFAAPTLKGATTDPVEIVDFAERMSTKFDSDMLRVRGIKIHPEAGLVTKNSPFLTPYEGTDQMGTFGVSPERMMALVLEANARNLDVYVHVEGNAVVRAAIDAFEESIRLGHDARNALHHLAFVTPVDYQRILDLNILVNATPQFTTSMAGQNEYMVEFFGQERVDEQLGRYTDLAHDGATISIAADTPGTPAAMMGPLFNMQVAMTLVDPSDPNSVPFPDVRKRLTLDQAIRAVTLDAARFLRMEEQIGSLAVGKYADLVVLGRDLRTVPVDELRHVEVLATMMDGRFTHRDGF